MKIVAFIMAFTIIALSIMPCMDENEFNAPKVKATLSKPDSQNNHRDSDKCSPFCSCACCSASVTHQVSAYADLLRSPFQEKKYPVYQSAASSAISFSIWQPPKLA